MFLKEGLLFQARNQIEREISIMKLVDHEHCVKLFNVFNSSNQVYLVLEIMTGGELFDRIISKVSVLSVQRFAQETVLN